MPDERRLTYRFAAIPDWVLKHPDLDAHATRVFGLMARFSEAFPSLSGMASDCACSVDTIRRAIRKLEAAGAVIVTPRYREDGGRSSNAYRLAGDTPLAPVQEAPLADTRPAPLAPVLGQEVEKSLEKERSKTPPTPPPQSAPIPPEAMFDRFWLAYPRKVGKPQARKAFAAAVAKVPIAEIGDGLRRWCCYWETRGEDEFIPHASTWLNRDGWNDEPPKPHRPRANGGLDYLLAKIAANGTTTIETTERSP